MTATVIDLSTIASMIIDETDPRAAEPLVDLRCYGLDGENYYGRNDGANAPYHRRIEGSITGLWARRSVAERLAAANASLARDGLALWIFDAYRPQATQQGLWQHHSEALRQQHPDWTAERLDAETGHYVAAPTLQAPHLSGGAVDLTLCRRGGELLDCGSGFDAIGAPAATDWFERAAAQGACAAKAPALLNRRHLYWTLRAAGFTNYAAEWWHYDYGNRLYTATRIALGEADKQVAFYDGIDATKLATDGLG